MPAANQLPIIVDLHSHITYPDDEEHLTVQAIGTATWLHKQLYLRFTEPASLEGQSLETKVMIKFESDGSLQMRRTNATSTSQMHFINGQISHSHYQTPAGMLFLAVDTHDLQTNINPKTPNQGKLDLTYSLSQNDLVVGHYHVQLTFKPS